MRRKRRVLLAKVGLNGHDRGIKIIANAFRDAGMEIIYTGLHQTPEDVVTSALQEDVDVIGISILSGVHMQVFRRLTSLMKKKGIAKKLLFGGGIIPEIDIPKLKKLGVDNIFGPGTSTSKIIEFINEKFKKHN